LAAAWKQALFDGLRAAMQALVQLVQAEDTVSIRKIASPEPALVTGEVAATNTPRY
jgi:hypothetical protein